MGWSDGDAMMRCKKHPKHRQSAGVCSLCLVERLSDLAAANNAKANSSQAATYFSSSDASTSYSTHSSPSSPAGGTAAKSAFFSGPLLGGRAPMFRSKSVAVVVERPAPQPKERRRRSGTGFWSKLMMVGTKRRKAPAPAASSEVVGVRN